MTIVLCDACGSRLDDWKQEVNVSFETLPDKYHQVTVCRICAAKAAEQLTKYKRENKNG